MQFFTQGERQDNRKRLLLLIPIVLAVVALILYFAGVFSSGTRHVSAVKLRCISTQEIKPFGDSILFYDGSNIVCLNKNGSEKWSYTVGSDASFDAGNNAVVIWSGTQLSILDKSGRSTYDNNVGQTIQFARAGTKYICAVLGDDSSSDSSSVLKVYDLQGVEQDSESTAYEDMLIMDAGFFSDGDYLWTTAMDLYGTVPSTTLSTYRVPSMNTGSVELGENIVYKVLYCGTKLNVISTRQLRVYDYRGTQDTTGTLLVYGWQLIDSDVSGQSAALLFAPSSEVASMSDITDLRYIKGKADKRFTLPAPCVGAAMYNNRIYAFSSDGIYRADLNGSRFSVFSQPMSDSVTKYIGMLTSGTAIVACDLDVYALTLP